MSTDTLSTWQNASIQAGGSAAATAGSLQNLTNQFEQIKLTGQSPAIPYLRRLGINSLAELNNLPGVFAKIHDQFKNSDPRENAAIGAGLGLDQGMINLLQLPDDQYKKIFDEQQKLGVITARDAAAGIALTQSYARLTQASGTLGRSILTDLTPALVHFLDAATAALEWFVAHPRIAEAAFALLTLSVMKLSGSITGTLIRLALAPLASAFGLAGTAAKAGLGAAEVASGGLFASLGLLLSRLSLVGLALTTTYAGFRIGGLNTDEDKEIDRLRRAHGITGGPIADTAMDNTKKGFLDTLAGPESGGAYNIKNGGSHFKGYDQFPEGVGTGGTSSAAGRYQFTSGTWKDVSAKAGLSDFSPANQDRGAWYLADTTYRQNTGRSLEDDLQAGGHQQQIATALAKVWPSLPGGSQTAQSLAQFNENLARNMGGSAPRPQPDPGLLVGARAGVAGNITNDNSRSNTSTSETHIGKIEVHASANDAAGIAKGIGRAMSTYGFVPQANTGLA